MTIIPLAGLCTRSTITFDAALLSSLAATGHVATLKPVRAYVLGLLATGFVFLPP
jgi:hypothetical protein